LKSDCVERPAKRTAARRIRTEAVYVSQRTPTDTHTKRLLSERLYPLLRETDEATAHRLATIADRNQSAEIINELIYE